MLCFLWFSVFLFVCVSLILWLFYELCLFSSSFEGGLFFVCLRGFFLWTRVPIFQFRGVQNRHSYWLEPYEKGTNLTIRGRECFLLFSHQQAAIALRPVNDAATVDRCRQALFNAWRGRELSIKEPLVQPAPDNWLERAVWSMSPDAHGHKAPGFILIFASPLTFRCKELFFKSNQP